MALSSKRAKPNSQVVRCPVAPLTAKAGSSYDTSHSLIYQLLTIWYSRRTRPTAPFAVLPMAERMELPVNVLDQHLADFDPEVAELIGKELQRQRNGLEMIASENHAPLAVMQAQGSVLTNKYAEGYPGRRYYGGCEHVDVIEQMAIDRIKALFHAEFANVQPHSGAQANATVMHALLKPGDTILGLSLDCGGHLTHGMRLNFSGKLYTVAAYGVSRNDYLIDMDQVAEAAREHRPQMIIAGWSAYPRHQDFARFREIADEVSAYLMVDMAHFAGLVAAGLHPSPVPHAHVVTSTTHKTLGGPRGGIILTNEADIAKKLNSAVFPGQQGGPLEHVIAGKAVAFKMAARPDFVERQRRCTDGAKILAERLCQPDVRDAGITVLTGGTEVHLVLVDLRIGTPALAARGFQDEDFAAVADLIAQCLIAAPDADTAKLKRAVGELAERYPLYPEL